MPVLDQGILFLILAATLVLFVWGRWRYDMVAVMALLASVIAGLIPAEIAFRGFGHPAVIIVAAVLIVSRALGNAGVVDAIARWMSRAGDRITLQVAALTGVAIVLSAFVSSIAAVAVLIPVAIRMARKSGHPPSALLMPLAFGALLGAQLTLIGSAPNIIISTFRAQANAEPFRMFDYSRVGFGVAISGFIFVSLAGWRLIPRRKAQLSPEDLFKIEDYITEVRIPDDSPLHGKPLRELEAAGEQNVTVVGLVRNDRRRAAPSSFETLHAGDILIVEADSEQLKSLTDRLGLQLVGSQDLGADALRSDSVTVSEVVVTPTSPIVRKTAQSINLRWRYGINLLAVARQGKRLKQRLGNIRFQTGDVLLVQGIRETLQEMLPVLGCLPLAERGLRIGRPRRILLSVAIFAAAIIVSATGRVPVTIAFVTAAGAMILAGLLTLREAYESIDWSIVVLLGALIPVGQALETTGAADLIAGWMLAASGTMPPPITLGIVLISTMFLSDLINNGATAVLMAPIALKVAEGIGASPDPFLMAVAVGASCAFLTPIGNQSNTVVLGPGGYRFTDYWRMGLPLEVVVVAVAIPLLLRFWPL